MLWWAMLRFFHDLNGLAVAARHGLKLIAINNGGGAIFGYLAQKELPEFEQGWLTPPGLDLATVADLFGFNYWRIETDEDPLVVLDQALSIFRDVDRDARLARGQRVAHHAWWRASARDDG